MVGVNLYLLMVDTMAGLHHMEATRMVLIPSQVALIIKGRPILLVLVLVVSIHLHLTTISPQVLHREEGLWECRLRGLIWVVDSLAMVFHPL